MKDGRSIAKQKSAKEKMLWNTTCYFLLYIYNYAFCSYFMTLQAKIEARIRKYKNIKDFSYKNIKDKI